MVNIGVIYVKFSIQQCLNYLLACIVCLHQSREVGCSLIGSFALCLIQYMHSNTIESKPLFWENYTKGTLFGHHKRTNSRSTTSNPFIGTPKHYNATLPTTYSICELIKRIYNVASVQENHTTTTRSGCSYSCTIAVCLGRDVCRRIAICFLAVKKVALTQ